MVCVKKGEVMDRFAQLIRLERRLQIQSQSRLEDDWDIHAVVSSALR